MCLSVISIRSDLPTYPPTHLPIYPPTYLPPFCSRSLLDMADAMITLGSATPSPAKRAPKLASARKAAVQLWQRLARKYKQMVVRQPRDERRDEL